MATAFRLLTDADVRRALTGVDLIGLMDEALRALSAREVVQPVRSAMFVGPARNVLGFMPAHLPSRGALGAKVLAVFNANADRGLPSHFATIVLMNDGTGELLSIMDGGYITEVRTAAVSGVAVRHLAAGPVRRLGIFGCGVQAGSHLRMMAAAHPTLQDVRVWSPLGDPGEFARAMQRETGLACVSVPDAEQAATGADVIVLATASSTPVIDRRWVADGTLVVSVGACRPDQREMDPALVADARLVVDSMEAALIEAGDIVQALREGRIGAAHVLGELGDVAAGRLAPRRSPADIVVFKSLGLAVEDVATADVVYRIACEQNLGTVAAI